MKLKLDKQINYIDNNNFKTIQIKVLFHFKEKLEELALSTLLPNLINFMNNDYPSEDSFKRAKLDKYILGINCSKQCIGLESTISFNLVIPDIDTIGEDLLEEQIQFFSSFIYNPLVKDNSFDIFELEREKENLRTFIDNSYKNIRPYQSIRLRELIDDQGILSMDIATNRELIDKVNAKNLYDFFKKVVINNSCIVFVMGNTNHKKITSLLNKYIIKNKFINEFSVNYNNFLKPRDKVNIVNEKSQFKDSSLSIVYKIKNMSEKDKTVMAMVYGLLSSLSSRLLSKKLRDEGELVYSTRAIPYSHYGCFEITAYINKDNKDLVYEKILEVIEELKNENVDDLLEKLKERKRISIKKNLDDKFFILNDYVSNVLGIEEEEEVIYKEMLKVTSKDISKFVKRFVLDTVYFIEEENND